MKFRVWPPRTTWLLELVVVAAIYFGAAEMGLLLAFRETNVSPVWPPTGVALAAVLLLGYRVWPGIVIGAALANIVTFSANGLPVAASILPSCAISVGNTLEALTGAFLIQRLVGERTPFNRAQDVFKFIVAALLATMVSATIGVISLILNNIADWANFGYLWWTWWVGDAVGALVVTPVLLIWIEPRQPQKPWPRLGEAVFTFGLLAVGAWLVFGIPARSTSVDPYRLEYLIIPGIVWIVFRFGRHGATMATFIAGVIAVWYTVHGRGPFTMALTNDSLLLLQSYLAVVAVTTLTLAGVLTERKRANKSLQRRAAELVALNTIAEAVSHSLELPQILELTLEQAMTLTGLEGGTICLIPPGQDTLHLVAEREASPEMVVDLTQNEVKVGECLCGDAAQTQQPVILWGDASASSLAREAARDEGINFHGAFPLVMQERSIGVLCVFTRTDTRPTERSLEILQIACGQIAIAIENARLYEQAQRHAAELEQHVAERTTELTATNEQLGREIVERKGAEEALRAALTWTETLYRTSRSLIAIENLPQLLQAVVDGVAQVLPANRVIFMTVDLAERRVIHFVKGGPGSNYVEPVSFDELWLGLSGWVLRERQPALSPQSVPDPREAPVVQQRRRETNCGAIMVVPVRYRDKVMGTMTAINHPDERDFTEPDVELMLALANQAAIAISNAQLYKETARRAEELAVLYQISRDLVTIFDLDRLLPAIAQRITDVLEADRCAIFLIDEETSLLRARTAHGYMAERLSNFGYRPGEEIVGQAYATGKPQYVPDLDRVPDLPRRDQIRTVLAVPLASPTAGPLGVFSVTSLQVDAFTPDRQQLLETMAGQIAGVIENARLYRASERHAAELAVLYEIGKDITSTLELDTMLQAIAEDTVRLMNSHKSLILLIDARREELIQAVGYGYDQAQLAAHTFARAVQF